MKRYYSMMRRPCSGMKPNLWRSPRALLLFLQARGWLACTSGRCRCKPWQKLTELGMLFYMTLQSCQSVMH